MTGTVDGHGVGQVDGAHLLEEVIEGRHLDFAVINRGHGLDTPVLDVLVGSGQELERLADVQLREAEPGAAGPDALVLVPFRQLAERGFEVNDDASPLLAMQIREHGRLPAPAAIALLPDILTPLRDGRFDLDDEQYAELAAQVVREQIGSGAGANFVLGRSYRGVIEGYTPRSALALLRRLLLDERGAYWTFLIHVAGRTLIGASPERHVSVADDTAIMNPISGTYRYPNGGPTVEGLSDFLADRKETEELFMVVDEELKMMARICADGARVIGPFLKEMAGLAHTEYFLQGRTELDMREVLRETLLAPTVTGSPLENACRVIARYEPQGRGYYSGVAALIGHDASARQTLDSAIIIRTAELDARGALRLCVGATLVRHSDPRAEAAETRVKARALLKALNPAEPAGFASHPAVVDALAARNDELSDFWLTEPGSRWSTDCPLAGTDALIVDAEDTFTSMIAIQLRSIGLRVRVQTVFEVNAADLAAAGLVVVGPGPGDPTEMTSPKIAALRAVLETLLRERIPFLSICLSHQVLCTLMDLPVRRRAVPNQGTQRRVDVFGVAESVGFYNAFAAHCETPLLLHPQHGEIEVSRDAVDHEVHALRGERFVSIQFHVESVLSSDGPAIFERLLTRLVDTSVGVGPTTPTAKTSGAR